MGTYSLILVTSGWSISCFDYVQTTWYVHSYTWFVWRLV